MLSLFPQEQIFPEGFSYTPEFLHAEEEIILADLISNVTFHKFIFQGFEAKRKVASFGYDYSFNNRKLTKGNEIPPAFDWLIEKVKCYYQMENNFVELLITEYPAGSVINWHRDAPPFDIIVGVSISGDCIFSFRPHDKGKQTRNAVISIPVQRRSAYIIQSTARSDWQHSILPVKTLRYSITLRTLRDNI